MKSPSDAFAIPVRGREQDEGFVFRPKFNSDGLVTAVTCDANTGKVLMVAHMNAEALAQTIETAIVHYWSRSRQAIWMKGETSGNRQKLIELHTDCDQDAVVLTVEQEGAGAACHTGRFSCFYRKVVLGDNGDFTLVYDGGERVFDPDAVYETKPDKL